MFSRRTILKILGISPLFIKKPEEVLSYIPEGVRQESVVSFLSINRWLRHVSETVRKENLLSFRILVSDETIDVVGNFDAFALAKKREYQEYLNDSKRTGFYDLLEEAGKEAVGTVCFQIDRSKAPEKFAEQLKTKHGRMTFVDWLHSGNFRGKNSIEKFFVEVKAAQERELEKRFIFSGEGYGYRGAGYFNKKWVGYKNKHLSLDNVSGSNNKKYDCIADHVSTELLKKKLDAKKS